MSRKLRIVAVSLCALSLLTGSGLAIALSPLPPPGPGSGSVGLEGTISTAAPTQASTIAVPTNGQVFTSIPITVSGLCTSGLLVKLFSNNIFTGSTLCSNGSYSLQSDLFAGRNDLITRVYDALDQSGPDSNLVSVTFNDAQLTSVLSQVLLTSAYARLGANPGQELDWPLVLSGGSGPYAISTDWGDGKAATLQSVAEAGNITIKHTYDTAGVYQVIIRATDASGGTAYLEVVGVANGQVTQSSTSKNAPVIQIKTVLLWWPALALLPLLLIAFWLGVRYEKRAIRKEYERGGT